LALDRALIAARYCAMVNEHHITYRTCTLYFVTRSHMHTCKCANIKDPAIRDLFRLFKSFERLNCVTMKKYRYGVDILFCK